MPRLTAAAPSLTGSAAEPSGTSRKHVRGLPRAPYGKFLGAGVAWGRESSFGGPVVACMWQWFSAASVPRESFRGLKGPEVWVVQASLFLSR